MAHTGMSSAEARKRVLTAQFAGLGLAVLAVALWAFEVPGLGRGLPAKPTVDRIQKQEPVSVTVASLPLDRDQSMGIGERLDIGANRPAPKVESPTAPVTEPPVAPASTQWKYLGAIRQAQRLMALISVEGSQKIVSEGSRVALKTPGAEGRPETVDYQATVVAVTPEHIDIEEAGGARRRVELEAKSSKVSWVKNMPTTVANAPVAVAAMAGMTPEAKQRLVAQGINLAEAERARLAAALANGRNVARPDLNPAAAAAAARAAAKGVGVAKSGQSDADAVTAKQDAADPAEQIRRKAAEAGEIN